MTDIRPPTPEELSAYADGELEPDRQAEIALYLSEHEEHDRRMAADTAILRGLRTLRQKASADVPKTLLEVAAPKLASSVATKRVGLLVALIAFLIAVLAVATLVGSTGQEARYREALDREVAERAAYFLGVNAAGVEFDTNAVADIRRALPSLTQAAVDARTMDQSDFVYLGGRTSSIGGTGAVILFYEDASGGRYGLTIWEDSDVSAMPALVLPASETLYWSEGGHRFAITGDNGRDQLEMFRAAYRLRSSP